MFSYCENIVAIGALIFCLKIQEVSWHQFQCNIGTSIRREVFIRKAWRLGSQFSWYDSCLSTKEMSSSNSKTLPLLGGWQGLPPGIKKIVMKKARGKHLGFNVLVNFNLGPHQQNDYCKNVMNNGMTLTWLSCRYSYPRMYIHENICVRVFAYKLCIYIYICVFYVYGSTSVASRTLQILVMSMILQKENLQFPFFHEKSCIHWHQSTCPCESNAEMRNLHLQSSRPCSCCLPRLGSKASPKGVASFFLSWMVYLSSHQAWSSSLLLSFAYLTWWSLFLVMDYHGRHQDRVIEIKSLSMKPIMRG